MKQLFLLLVLLIISTTLMAQSSLSGKVLDAANSPAINAYVEITNSLHSYKQSCDLNGRFEFESVDPGSYTLKLIYLGHQTIVQTIELGSKPVNLDLNMEESAILANQVVVTGTKTFKRKTNSPVVVQVVNSKTLEAIQACNLSEGLKFQPGLRVETDCQTCNYTQLRMNGLAGGYSQILINGRPIFSPLTGLYGLEQLPANMIDRIEIIRGGGSSLYGSSAIGGTVNILTKIPTEASAEVNYTLQQIGGQAMDHVLNGTASVLNNKRNAGLSFFISNRSREAYDANEDNYSELPQLKNTSLGMNAFYQASENHKLEASISHLNEYRFGGEMVDKAAYLTKQSEERVHDVWMGSLDYQWNINPTMTNLIVYLAGQHTYRKHYTGIQPLDSVELASHFAAPPYGNSVAQTLQFGTQINHQLFNNNWGKHILTIGSEYVYDDVQDEIASYAYKIDQQTKNLGTFVQSDWAFTSRLSLLAGLRMDKHNMVPKLVWSPRAALLYKLGRAMQFRLGYGTGFRAPQAFDADLHLAFAGGGVSRVTLAKDLQAELARSWNASVNYDYVQEKYVTGFTLEGFYTNLDRAFILQPKGSDQYGEVFEKQNGQGATVQGLTLELRANYNRKIQLESGLTIQQNAYDNAVQYIDEIPGIKRFIRTPQHYGFANLSFTPNTTWSANINYVYTGSMLVPHFAGAVNHSKDEIIESKPFHDLSFKLGYNFIPKATKQSFKIFFGLKNVLNSYQNNFDKGRFRDSNFVYGPAQPRSIFGGIQLNL